MPSSPSIEKTSDDVGFEHGHSHTHDVGHHHRHDVEADPQHLGDEEFGGHEERKKLEKRLLRKLDARMSILIVIYILNYVRNIFLRFLHVLTLDVFQIDRNNAS